MAQSSPIPSTSPAVRGRATRRRNFSLSSGSFTVPNRLNPEPGDRRPEAGDRRDCQRIPGKVRRKSMTVSSVPGGRGGRKGRQGRKGAKRCLTIVTPFERIPYAAGPVRPAKLSAVRAGARQTMKQEIGTRWKKVL